MLDKNNGVKSRVWLAEDVVVGREFSPVSQHQNYKIDGIDDRGMILDIGPKTVSRFTGIIGNSRTVFWNGPMGVFEWEPFSVGSREVANAVCSSGITSVIGGGSTVDAVSKFGFKDKMSHVSTGGGASLQFLEGRELPGLEMIPEKN